ncbi:MAG: Uma2 family endonuclease [Anaerolineae bacterium]|nr:Uma2 family endonuclease [Anaerolineae bacterium]
MVTTAVEMGLLTLDEFIRRFDEEGPFEILDGEIAPKMPNVARHTLTMHKLFRALTPFDQAGRIAVFMEATFVLLSEAGWVKGARIPDLMVYEAARLKAYYESTPDWEDKPFALVPDLAIEIVSPNDKYSDIDARVERYLQDGVRLVWIVDPQRRKVVAHRPGGAPSVSLILGDTLTGAEVIAEFALPLAELFAIP